MSEDVYAGVRTAYDTVADTYAARFPDTRPETGLDLAMVDAFLAALGARARVLDAGCGAGRMSRHLADRGAAVEGMDLSPGMVAAARRDHPDLTFSVGSLSDLPHRDNTFDGVLLWYSTIHTPPEGQPRLFQEAARVLRPGGHLLVGFQSGSGVRDVAPTWRTQNHEISLVRYCFTAGQVATWLAGAGLRETARLERAAQGAERDGQAMLLAISPEPA